MPRACVSLSRLSLQETKLRRAYDSAYSDVPCLLYLTPFYYSLCDFVPQHITHASSRAQNRPQAHRGFGTDIWVTWLVWYRFSA